MHSFLSVPSLQEFLELVGLPGEKKNEYLSILPQLTDEGRLLLFEMLTKLLLLQVSQNHQEKIIEAFRAFAADYDYDKLKKTLG